MLPLLAQLGQRFWMPDPASTYAPEIDWVFYFTYWASAIACVLIVIAMVLMVIRYRRRPGHTAQPSPAHSTALEMTWTLVPSVVFVMIFYWGFKGFMDIANPPDHAYEIHVTGFQWGWSFQYPNGATSNELHVPVDRPIRLILQSDDVIHSFFVPAFRTKKDIVPGRYNITWFEANRTGEFDLYCAEYCGQSHSTMVTKAVVHDQGSFDHWVAEAAVWIDKVPPVEAGLRLWNDKGCKQCHTYDGTPSTGPTFKNMFRKEGRQLRSGETIVADENYIHESIVDPGAHIVAGYDNVMPRITIKDQEITAIIEWMKSITDDGPKPMEAWPAKEGEQAPAGEGEQAPQQGEQASAGEQAQPSPQDENAAAAQDAAAKKPEAGNSQQD